MAQGTCRSTTIPGHLSLCVSGWSVSLLLPLEALTECAEAPAFHAGQPRSPLGCSVTLPGPGGRAEPVTTQSPTREALPAPRVTAPGDRAGVWHRPVNSLAVWSRRSLPFSASVYHLRDERNPFLGPLSADHCVDTFWKWRCCPQEEVLGPGAASKGHGRRLDQGRPLPGVLCSDAPRAG